MNWAIDTGTYLQPSKSEWNEHDPSVSPGALKEIGGEDLGKLKEEIVNRKDRAYDEKDLVRLYDTLPAAKAQEHLIGRAFDGKILRTNRSVLDLAEWFIVRPLSWFGINWGKRYLNQHVGDPLVFNFLKRIYTPIPIWGNVGMDNIEWRNTSVACMKYDAQNWTDFFKILEHDEKTNRMVLLGVWTARRKAGGWFTLTYDASVPVPSS